jgi:hypothetical protein
MSWLGANPLELVCDVGLSMSLSPPLSYRPLNHRLHYFYSTTGIKRSQGL